MYATDANLKMYEKRPLSGLSKANPDDAPSLRTSSKDIKKFYLWFRFPGRVVDILDTENETGNGHSFPFESKQKC